MERNIVLIGMPGSGKTTVGKLLNKKLGMRFVDVDDFIEQECGKTITELFDAGESHFRNIESIAIKKLSLNNSLIIATGGGVVKSQANIDELKKNGIIIFINRPVENIVKDVEISKRPLLKDGIQKIYDLYNERYSLYMKYCDFQVVNDSSIEDVADKIIKKYKLS